MLGVYKKYYILFLVPIVLGLIISVNSVLHKEPILITDDKTLVYLGGELISINMNANGVIITSDNGDIKAGDIIYKVNDQSISNRSELNNAQNNTPVNDVTITYYHDNEILTKNISKDDLKNINGINNLFGNATITYINPNNLKYAAVAHSIIDNVTIKDNNLGTINKNYITSIIKTENDITGRYLTNKGSVLGSITAINETGIYGKYNNVKDKKLIEVGKAKKGTAYIVTTLDTNKKAYYEIEITNIYNRDNKEIEFIIKDDLLLSKTNGILKGMSGSPIVQDDKLVGAVSHAVNNPTKDGYGLDIYKMIVNTK